MLKWKVDIDAEIMAMQSLAPVVPAKVYPFLMKLLELQNLKSGVKKCHGVIAHDNKKLVQQRRVGDWVVFFCGKLAKVRCRLESICIFSSVGAAFKEIPFQNFVPQYSDVDSALQYYCHLSTNTEMRFLAKEDVSKWDQEVGRDPQTNFYVWFTRIMDHDDPPQIPVFEEEDSDGFTPRRNSDYKRGSPVESDESLKSVSENKRKHQSEVESLRKKITSLQDDLSGVRSELADLKKKINAKSPTTKKPTKKELAAAAALASDQLGEQVAKSATQFIKVLQAPSVS